MMSLNSYIESLTKIDKTKSPGNVTWSKVVQEKSKPKPFRGKGIIPYQIELEKTDQRTSRHRDQKYSGGTKANSYETYRDSKAKYGKHRFAEIIPCVREVGGGYNTFSNQAIEMRFKENQSKYSSTEESDLSTVYTTATSKSADDSFNTATETLGSLKLSSDESKNDVSNSEKKRYKKNALMAGLLHTLDKKSVEENWDKDESDERMYEGRIIRFFQSAEDEDVYVHPLKEQIQKDPEWQKYQLQRKGVDVIQTARQFYLDLDEDDFNFEPRNSA